jgi:glycosyltransferase involved in cell wall biosynthesis
LEVPSVSFSIGIPQYNRIEFLLKNLETIEYQDYPYLEVIVSDDCSTDGTQKAIEELIENYKHKLVYFRFDKNQGYDRNFRKTIELANNQYVIILGNDDTLNPEYSLWDLAKFLMDHNFPDLGFTNYLEDQDRKVVSRATKSALLGTGADIALTYYSCFSFVAGIIYRREAFLKNNTSKMDGSIYAQIYMASLMTCRGNTLFSIKDPLVIKDIQIDQVHRNSYKDTLAKRWSDFKVVDAGLHSVISTVTIALFDSNQFGIGRLYKLMKRIYRITFPFWIQDYRSQKATPEAIGLIMGMWPFKNQYFNRLALTQQIGLIFWYSIASVGGLIIPVAVFNRLKSTLHDFVKKV